MPCFAAWRRGSSDSDNSPSRSNRSTHSGWAAAATYAKQQAREYEHNLDLAHLQAYTPKDRAELLQHRLDQHFARRRRTVLR